MRSRFMSQALFAVGVLGLALSAASPVHASSPLLVPEIDAATMAAGLGVLTGGVLMLRTYWRSR